MRFALAVVIAALAAPVFAQEAVPQAAPPAAGWTYPQLIIPQANPLPIIMPPGPVYVPASQPGPIPTGLPERTVLLDHSVDQLPPLPVDVAAGQQHWVAVNLGVFQPFALRAAVKVWSRPQNSVWVEAYLGSALFDVMYGFGVRMQHTAMTFGNGDRLMLSPGIGVHILPDWDAEARTRYYDPYTGYSYYRYTCTRNTLYYVFGDIDISWLHDFTPHVGFEVGLKLGLAGRVSGQVGRDYPSGVMFGKDVYPIISIYSGLRF